MLSFGPQVCHERAIPMRLTLRTMLAYLDDVLDPVDAQELEHKIEESSFASGLVHRIRDSMRRMRLGAPKLDGRGLGLDANTVADYLDSTLAPERVPEFEKVCLESDVHLAEVASCHQILTLVLGEPAQVDAAMRERIYRIGHADNRKADVTSNAAANGTATRARNAGGAPAGTSKAANQSTVQRPSQPSAKSLVITLLLGFLAAIVALQAIGVDKIRGMIGLSSREVVESPSPESTESVSSNPTPPEQPAPESHEPGPPLRPEADEHDLSRVRNANTEPATNLPIDSRPIVTAEDNSDTAPDVMPDSAPGMATPSSPEEAELPSVEDAAVPIIETETTDPPKMAEVAAAEPPKQLPVGRYISEEQQVLARFDAAAGDYFRMAPDSTVVTGQRVISLPTYRPQLLLSPNIKVTLAGESHVQFGKTEEEAPVLIIESGRVTVMPLGEPEAPVYIEAAGRTGSILFADADSQLALEVIKYLPPGQKPEIEPAIPIIQIFATSGNVAWREEEGKEFVISAGQVLTIDGADSPALFEAGELPAWVSGKDLADIDRLASAELTRDLATDRPLSLSLLERTEFRQVEVRSLACRSLCALDMFDPTIKALEGPGLRSYWYTQFDALRSAMSRNPRSAIKLQRSLEKLAGDDAGLMYELLCGFNPDQLAGGGAKALVDALEHERVSTRVLAYENLRRITDKTQLFRPEQPPAQQKGEVMKWRRNLDAGAIVYLSPPQPLPTRVAVTTADGREPLKSE